MEISSIENSNLHIQIKNLNICTTHSKTHGKSGEVATLDEMLRILLRVSSKLPSSPSSLLSSVIAVLARTSAYPGTTAAFARTLITSIKKDEEKHLKQNKDIIWREEMNLKPSILAETQHLIVIAVLLPAVGIEPTSRYPKNLLTTEALYHSATEVLIEFDKYFGSRVV